MKTIFLILLLGLASCSYNPNPTKVQADKKVSDTPMLLEQCHGTTYKDEFAWLRDPNSPDSNQKLQLLDETKRRKNQNSYSLLTFKLSPDEAYLAWVENASGTNSLYIRQLLNADQPVMQIDNVKGDIAWSPESDSIYYVELDERGREFKVVIQSPVPGKVPTTIYEEKDDERFVSIHKTVSGEFLVINSRNWANSEVLTVDLKAPVPVAKMMLSKSKNATLFLEHAGGRFIAQSDIKDENTDVFTFSTDSFNVEQSNLLVDSPTDTIIKESIVFDTFVATHERNRGLDQLRITDLSTEEQYFAHFEGGRYSRYNDFVKFFVFFLEQNK